LTVDSTSLTVGGTVTLRGTGCLKATAVTASLGPEYLRDASALQAGADGDWSEVFTIPELVVGPTLVRARCDEGPAGQFGSSVVGYPTPVRVTVSTPYRIQVEPSGPVRPGASLMVSSVTGGCPQRFETPAITLENPEDLIFSPEGSNAVYVQGASTASWTTPYQIPTSTAHGQYDVVARCYVGRGFSMRTYEPVLINVS